MSEERGPKFGEPFPALPMSDFHAINAATINHAPTTNDDLMRLIQLRPSWETLAPSSVTPHLLRRILSDDTVIQALQEKLTETEADRDQARAELETLRAGLHDEWGVRVEGDRDVQLADDEGDARWRAGSRNAGFSTITPHRVVTRLVGEWREPEGGDDA